MYKLKLANHYKSYVRGILVYYLQFEGLNERFMTLNKREYQQIVKQGYIEEL